MKHLVKLLSSQMLAGLMLATRLAAAEPDAAKPVTIDAATRHRLAVVTAPAHSASQAKDHTGFARVLDPLPLAQLDADIAAAAAAASASAAEADRSRALFAADATVSRRMADSARAQALGDRARLSLLRRRLGLEWGPAIARLSDGRRSALIGALAAGRDALVRIDTAGGVAQSGVATATLQLGELGDMPILILGPARTADARLQSPGLIGLVSGAKARFLSAGLVAPVRIGGARTAGIFVPATAVLRMDGATWVYVQTSPAAYLRRRLTGIAATSGGLIAASGIRPGEPIVTAGSAALYAAERGGGPAED